MGRGTSIIRIIVRSRKDANAVKASIERFMPGWGIDVQTLSGARGSQLVDLVEDSLEPFTIVLLGSEDSNVAGEIKKVLPFTEIIVTRGRKVRNNTIEMIAGYLSKARASIRLYTEWDGSTFRLAKTGKGRLLSNIPLEPWSDNFIIFGRGARILRSFILKGSGDSFLLFKDNKGSHLIYNGPNPIGKITFHNGASKPPSVEVFRGVRGYRTSIDAIVSSNRDILEILSRRTVEWLRSTVASADTVIVPWSGGKDSTAALLVAVEAFGKDRVKAIYVDTGIDFIENLEYVENIASQLGIEVVIKKADVDKGLLSEFMPMPDPDYRWCTGRKLDALREGFKEVSKGKTIVIAGDRDAESEKRARRPPIRYDEKLGYPVISPLKLWSGVHVEAFILSRGLPLNPLYEKGFYRIGCYVCFALRNWEIEVMKRNKIFDEILRRRPEQREIIKRFIDLKMRDHGGELGDCICNI